MADKMKDYTNISGIDSSALQYSVPLGSNDVHSGQHEVMLREFQAAGHQMQVGVFVDGLQFEAWVMMLGCGMLLCGIVLLIVNACRQSILLRRSECPADSERLATIGVAAGWFSFMAAMGMALCSLRLAWFGLTTGGAVDQGWVMLNCGEAAVALLAGLFILAGSYFEVYLFKYLWVRKLYRKSISARGAGAEL